MTNREIYEAALHLLAQPAESGENEDFEERAPFLIAAFCNEVSEVAGWMRGMMGLSDGTSFDRVCLDMDEEFPLPDRFATAAALYVAAMLVLDEDASLSDRLYDRYCDAISSLRNGIPYTNESITDCYP